MRNGRDGRKRQGKLLATIRQRRKAGGDFHETITAKDVTKEYTASAKPGAGIVKQEDGYDPGKHRDEVAVAEWLHNTFGGDIVLLAEAEQNGVKTPDYLWNGRLWELKGASSVNGADKSLQKAIKQIHDNPSGVILNLLSDLNMNALHTQLSCRVARSDIAGFDLMILGNGSLDEVLRYKK